MNYHDTHLQKSGIHELVKWRIRLVYLRLYGIIPRITQYSPDGTPLLLHRIKHHMFSMYTKDGLDSKSDKC